jgi:hypothetical protein
MLFETIALAVFAVSSIAIFFGAFGKSRALPIIGNIAALAAALFLIVALPSKLPPWAHPGYGHRTHAVLNTPNAPVTTSAPAATASPDTSGGILADALQGTFNLTKTTLNQLLRASTGDQTRVVSDEVVLQTVVGIGLTLLFALFGVIVSAIQRIFRHAAA